MVPSFMLLNGKAVLLEVFIVHLLFTSWQFAVEYYDNQNSLYTVLKVSYGRKILYSIIR